MVTPREFFSEIFGELRSNEQLYVWSKKPHRRILVDSPEEIIEAVNDPEVRGSDLYFGVGIRVRGGFDDVSRVTTAWVDADGKDYGSVEKARTAVHSFPVEPSFVVSSGHGFHAYWLLSNSVNPRRASQISEAIQKAISSDPVNDATRVLRIPGTINYKNPDEPVPVAIEYENQHRRYDADDILALGNLQPKTVQKIVSGDTRGYKSRSERDWAVIRELVGLGISRECLRSMAEDRPIGERWRDDDFRLLEQDYDSAQQGYSPGVSAFQEQDAGTFYATTKGLMSVGTFSYAPTKLLQGSGVGGEDTLLGEITAFGKSWPDVVLPRSAFSSEAAFHKLLTSAFWQWYGNNQQTREYLVFLMSKLAALGMPISKSVHTVGRHGEFWVTRTQTLSVDQAFSTDEAPIVFVGEGAVARDETTGVVPATNYTDITDDEHKRLLGELRRFLPQINDPSTILPIMGWFFAAPLKTLILEAGYKFPLLNVFGTLGSGKTATLTKVFLPLLGLTDPATNTANTTDFVLRRLFSSTNAIPVVFGEYRASTTQNANNDFYQLLRMSYDSGMDSRGRRDLTTVTYRLSAPVVIDGEDPLTDPALRQRSILVNMNPKNVIEGSPAYSAFYHLADLKLGGFSKRYIQRTLSETPGTIRKRMEQALELSRTICPGFIPDRIRNNLAVILMGLELFNEHLHTWGQKKVAWTAVAFSPMLGNVMLRLASGTQRILIDDFIEESIGFLANPTHTRVPFIYSYDEANGIVWLHLKTSAIWWSKDRRFQGKGFLESQSLRTQLDEKSSDPDLHYVLPERTITTKGGRRINCYGIRLQQAFIAGLSVPDSLDVASLTVRSGFKSVLITDEEVL